MEPDVVPYLLRHRLISTEHVVSGDLSVADASKRHRNFKITCGPGVAFLLKQGVGSDKAAAVAREASVLRSLEGESAVARYLPRCYDFDVNEHIIIQELFVDTPDLRHYHIDRGYFPQTLARAIGKALGTLHRLGPTAKERSSGSNRKARLPWVLSLHRPTLQFHRECSSANLQLIQVVQEFPLFCAELDRLRQEWKADCFIHGDIKWDNLLVLAAPGSGRRTRIKIVDWELADAGDPCWDTGSVFSDYLGCWLTSIPLTDEAPSHQFLNLAKHPLEKMLPALHAFWEAYARSMHLDEETSQRWLLRAVRFGAARLVQTAFEQLQDSIQISDSVETILQLSSNILLRPEDATSRLLGFHLTRYR